VLAHFATHVQARDERLTVLYGRSNAQTGLGELYLPFMEILVAVSGAQIGKEAEVTDAYTARLRKLAAGSARVPAEMAPESGYAIIEKVEILLDGTPVADVKTALASVMGADRNALWKSVPLVGQKLEPGRELVGFSITDAEAAQRFEQKRAEHDLAVKITYSGPNNEHWVSDGQGIVSAAGAMAG
jgi:hypothetical protein